MREKHPKDDCPDCGRPKDARAKQCAACCRGSRYRHGHSAGRVKSPTIVTYNGMQQRCHNPNNTHYAYYGGRGIRVCDRWRESFDNFLADMGERPSTDYSIDRLNDDLGYEPGNCVWALKSENTRKALRRRYA